MLHLVWKWLHHRGIIGNNWSIHSKRAIVWVKSSSLWKLNLSWQIVFFLGHFLITYIRAWQNVLNELGIAKFKFNTYIISVLVIFFLQMNYSLPKIDDFSKTTSSVSSKIKSFKTIPREFFAFYGNNYQMWNHVISAHVGRWQERRIQSEQKHFTETQKRFVFSLEIHNFISLQNLFFLFFNYFSIV